MMQVIVPLVLFTLAGMLSCTPLPFADNKISPSNDFQLYAIDGVRVSELPDRFHDIAMMCDAYRKVNALSSDRDPEVKIKGIKITDKLEESKINIPEEFPDTDSFQTSDISKSIRDRLNEIKSEVHEDGENIGIKDYDDETAERKERVRRNSVSSFPAEISRLLDGVCLTDTCLQVLKDYLEWRRQNGYPVYTGVMQLGK